MKFELQPYSANDITISRAKVMPRSLGDGQEEDTYKNETIEGSKHFFTPQHISDGSSTTQSHIAGPRKIRKPFQANISPLSKNINQLPTVRNVAEKLTKVSLFTSPDSVILSSIPQDFYLREKMILQPIIFPRLSRRTLHSSQIASMQRKEPKFVPYEPYKGCVTPIVKCSPHKLKIKESIALKSQPTLATEEKRPDGSTLSVSPKSTDKIVGMIADFEKEKSRWEKENSRLSSQNGELRIQVQKFQQEASTLNQQLSTQSQVNSELKRLLVASVGEDVQGRVQCLTEDKARMATMIRKYSEKVDKDFEEKEQMSIQCDVWRSKFLASSLLLDELAQWKGMLLQRIEKAKEAVRLLLEERDVAHPYLIKGYRHAYQVQEAFDPLHVEGGGVGALDSSDVVSLAMSLSAIAENVRDRLLGTLGRAVGATDLQFPEETRTPGEKVALQVLEECVALCKNKMSFPFSPDRSALAHRYHPNTRYEHLTVNCCGHCNGEIKVV